MAKYFIFMASILNTRCILDTCRRKKANSLENLRVLKKTKNVGVSCYTFEKQISIILLNWISYANRTSLYRNLHEKSHLSNFWFWNNYHNRFSMSRSWSIKVSNLSRVCAPVTLQVKADLGRLSFPIFFGFQTFRFYDFCKFSREKNYVNIKMGL